MYDVAHACVPIPYQYVYKLLAISTHTHIYRFDRLVAISYNL